MALTIRSYGRYGDHAEASGKVAVKKLIADRMEELCEEQFPRPDDEHYQISVARPDDWSITVFRFGVLALNGPDTTSRSDRYLCGPPAAELPATLLTFAEEPIERTLELPWQSKASKSWWDADLYLYALRSSMTDLHRAALKDEVSRLKALIAAGADLEAKDRDGMTALIWSVFAERLNNVKVLLTAGADPRATDRTGRSVLEYADGAGEYIDDGEKAKMVRLIAQAIAHEQK